MERLLPSEPCLTVGHVEDRILPESLSCILFQHPAQVWERDVEGGATWHADMFVLCFLTVFCAYAQIYITCMGCKAEPHSLLDADDWFEHPQ